jgi:tetratricopeptide (TPR) repeat protein
MVALNLSNELIVHSEVLSAYPTTAQVAEFLAEAMRRRDTTLGMKPHRPALIQLEDELLVAELTPQLNRIGVATEQKARPVLINNILVGLEEHLRGGPEPVGLLAMRGVKPPLVAALFAAAAEFYRAALWDQLSDRHIFAVEIGELKRKRLVVVLGNSGMEYALAVYENWAEIERLYEPLADPLSIIPAKGAHALYFNDHTAVPFADLEAIAQYGWELAGENGYPVPLILTRRGEAKRPQRTELQWYEAVLRALPAFVHQYLKPGDQEGFTPATATIPVATAGGVLQVAISYPGGILPSLDEELLDRLFLAEDEDEGAGAVDLPDRRALEGMFRGLMDDVAPGSVDEAQELIYQAWDERSPAKRIALARTALKRSPDCADAYVLLAEEEAKTLDDARALYEQGVAAGERALGKRFFQENTGAFWGLIETRPYMRARQGLADTLWALGREREADQHYRELLRLNPNDNQGVRYNLLNMLIEMNEDEAAHALIKTYADDAMAEWVFTTALLAYRQRGPGHVADAKLQAALKGNPYVTGYLTGKKKIPTRLPDSIGFGDENEAIHYALGYFHHWRRTPGAVEWLKRIAAQ